MPRPDQGTMLHVTHSANPLERVGGMVSAHKEGHLHGGIRPIQHKRIELAIVFFLFSFEWIFFLTFTTC